jgi:hypothetical protein
LVSLDVLQLFHQSPRSDWFLYGLLLWTSSYQQQKITL